METKNELKIKYHSYSLLNDKAFYIDCTKVFYAYFKNIPSIKRLDGIDFKAATDWVEKEFEGKILKRHSKELCITSNPSPYIKDIIYVLSHKIVIDIERDLAVVCFLDEFENDAQIIIDYLRKFREKTRTKPSICIVTEGRSGLDLKHLSCNKNKMELSEHYNDDLLDFDKKIFPALRDNATGGLFLLHGSPGTGKTSYIRHLVHRLKRKIIFLPLQIAESIATPSLVNLLIDNRNSVLVIEDAERLLASRDTENNFGISTILNITDGLLSDSLGIKIICTFNTLLSNIDNALLRKGRLKAIYEFKPLEVSKTKTLLEKIGIQNHNVTEPLTLAEIYNYKEQSNILNISGRTPIGFAAKVA